MDMPGRHGARIDAPVQSLEGWDGSIAYLDRDGVLNVGREDYVKSISDVVMLTGSGDAIAALRGAGYRIVIVTNQSPVNRGIFTDKDLETINQYVLDQLLQENKDAHVDLVLYSPYTPHECSPVRKPGAGMLQIARQLLSGSPLETKHNSSDLTHKFDEGRSFMAGDRDADIGAAWNHGIRAFRIDPEIGISGSIDRLLDDDDRGDALEI